MALARARLEAERKNWRRDHPALFYARPEKNPDGSLNIMRWQCGIPGKQNTIWAGAVYTLIADFSEEYPIKPPKCKFPAGFFHPNIFPSGTVCLSILNDEEDWKPAITMKQILLGIQDLLDNPNEKSPAQAEAYAAFMNDRTEYEKRVRQQVETFPPPS
eukprot:TRINITY_DN812_c1_g1_i1.p1 TRINITY_DN812_c1_g1~~TRINITY_DN812_c1_g1_i1.p1  ORF type:complete len:159 (+),score=78.48 TRINITY_DN812_c1_g1_i1:173-649(+)